MATSAYLQAHEHKGANHLLIQEGSKFSYVLVPSYISSQEEEPNLCFTSHNNSKWDPRVEQCCLREDGHVHAHVHHGDLIEDILLEQCIDEAGCTLPLPWDLASSCLESLSENKGHKGENHVHQEGCGHEQITHGDHLDWLVPMSDGSYLLSHDDGASEHGRLVKVGQSQGRLRKHSKRFFDLFKYEDPQAALATSLCSGASIDYEHSTCFSKEHVSDAVQSLLEDSDIQINISSEPAELQKTTLDVLGICCPTEIPLIKKILEPVPGVQEVYVNVTAKTVTVHHDPVAASPARLVKLLNAAHLEASIHVTGEWKAAHKWPTPYTIAAGIFVAIAMFHYVFGPLKWVALGAVAVGTPPILRKSFISLRRCILDINILMLIAVAGSISLGDYMEAGIIVFLFTLADWLESRSTDKARMAISSVANLAPQSATLADTGLRVSVAEIKVGTRLSVKAGESIPIDGIVISGRSAVDESSLTGESYPVEKEAGGRVWAGTINLTGYLCIETSALAEDSAVARMVRLVEDAQTQRSHFDQLVETFAKFYTPAVIFAALAIAIIPLIVHAHNIRHWLYLALVLLVVACPCALVISTPVTTTCAIAQAARMGLIVKGGKYLEALGKIKVVAMDKTGTLTEGCFQVVDVQALSKNADLQKLLHWVSCVESKASHPIASAVVEYAKLHGVEPNGHVDDFRTLVGEGVSGIVDGHEIIIGNERLADRLHWKGEFFEASLMEHWKSQGLTICWVGVDRKLELIFSAGDQLREEAVEAVKHMRDLGLHIAMLTGDSLAAAAAVHRKLGQIDVHAGLLPEDKVEVLKQLKKVGLTGMVGDGINDAPALAAADVGIAMGVAGTAIAMETADIALMKNDLRKLATAVKLGRQARRKIQQNIFLSFATKILVIVLAAVGYASLWGAVLADVGTCLVVIFNSMLILERNKHGTCLGFMHHREQAGKHCKRSKECTDGESCCSKPKSKEGPACCKSKACHGDGSNMHQDHIQSDVKNCCAAKSCCDVSEKSLNNGMRRRVSQKDTCAKDCQECSSVVVTISEESCTATNNTEPGNSGLKGPGLLGGIMSSKKGQHTCCQQQNKSVSRCCGNASGHTEQSLAHVTHSKIDGLSRGCEDGTRNHVQCCSETNESLSCNSSESRADLCVEKKAAEGHCGTKGDVEIAQLVSLQIPAQAAAGCCVGSHDENRKHGCERVAPSQLTCCSSKPKNACCASSSQKDKEVATTSERQQNDCCNGGNLKSRSGRKGCTDGESCCSKAKSKEGPACCKSKACYGDGSNMHQDHIQADVKNCCAAKSCCDVSEKSGMRRRVSQKDTCAKDCQGVECSSVVVTISEGSCTATNDLEPGNSGLKRPGLPEGIMSSKRDTCCQQQNKSISSCCGNTSGHTEQSLAHVTHSKIDELSRGCEDGTRSHVQCCSETNEILPCNSLESRAHLCVEAKANEGHCRTKGEVEIAQLVSLQIPAQAAGGCCVGSHDENRKHCCQRVTPSQLTCCSSKPKDACCASSSQKDKEVATTSERQQNDCCDGGNWKSRSDCHDPYGSCCVSSSQGIDRDCNGVDKNSGSGEDDKHAHLERYGN